jgi:DNA-binding PadR family transcriptional regulator
VRHVVLRILDVVPLHGYGLRELVNGYRFFYPMPSRNLYPLLRGLQRDGFVTSEEQVVSGRLRKVYAITEAGRAELRRWLSDPTTEPGTYRDPLVLKICLLTPEVHDPAARWIEAEIRLTRRAIEEGEQRVAEKAPILTRYTRSAAEYALDQARLRERWLRGVLELVTAAPQEAGELPKDTRERKILP